jgi:hypothetical protein
MPIEARVARTAHDLQHVNRLRVPKFGVLNLHVEIPSGPASKTYLQEGFTPERTDGRDDFHFAPVAETAKIVYRIDDPLQQLTRGKLELFRQQNATAIWHHDLTPDQLRDGEHRIDWTGERLAASESFAPREDFPDNCITAQHSPYKLKLTLGSDRESRGAMVAWTYLHVLVHEIEVDIGPRTVLSQDRDKNLYDTLGNTLFGIDYAANGDPGARRAEGAIKEIRLLSNIFQTAVAEMANNTDFQQYQTAWGDGPNLPVFAKIWIKSSAGQRVQAPRACGGIKLLWDWEDVTEVTTQYNTDTKTFVDNTLNFDKQTTRPRGDNCHHERGGKRGPGSNKVFLVTAGVAPAAHVAPGTFPFKAEACPTRTFAALSTAWGSGLYAGQSGVLFQPSRMAGDAFKVTVYFAYEKKPDGRSFAIDELDTVPPLHTTVKKTLPATYQIWRRINVVNQKKKKASVPDFPIAPFQGYYERGYVRMIASTAVTTWPQAEYNTKVANAVTAIGNVVVTASIDSGSVGCGRLRRCVPQLQRLQDGAQGSAGLERCAAQHVARRAQRDSRRNRERLPRMAERNGRHDLAPRLRRLHLGAERRERLSHARSLQPGDEPRRDVAQRVPGEFPGDRPQQGGARPLRQRARLRRQREPARADRGARDRPRSVLRPRSGRRDGDRPSQHPGRARPRHRLAPLHDVVQLQRGEEVLRNVRFAAAWMGPKSLHQRLRQQPPALIGLAVAAACAASQPSADQSQERRTPVEIALSLPSHAFLAGENIELQVSLRNPGGAPAEVPDPFNAINWQPTYTVQGPGYPKGTTFSFRSAAMKSAAPEGDERDAVLLQLAPGQEVQEPVPLQQWVDLSAPGSYSVSARLRWRGIDVSSKPVNLRIEQPRPAGAHFVRDESGTRALWLQRGERGTSLYEQHFAQTDAAPGVVRTHVLMQVAQANNEATATFSTPTRNDPAEMLNFWRGYREASGLVALGPGPNPMRYPLQEDDRLIQDPFLVKTGELDAPILGLRRIALVRFPKPDVAGSPRELWSATVREPPLEAAAAERIDRAGGRRIAFTSWVQGGLHLWLLDAAPERASVTGPIRAGEARPLPGARPALRIEPDGAVRAVVLYQRTVKRAAGASVDLLAMLDARFRPDGAPAGAPTLTDLGDVPATITASAVGFLDSGDPIWAVQLTTGELWHSYAQQRLQKIAGTIVAPLELLPRGPDAYVLVLPKQGAPTLYALR